MSIISKITNKILNNSLIEVNENDLNKTLEQLFVPNVDNILKSSLLTAINFTRDDDYALLIRCLTKVLKQISEQCPLNFPVYDIVGTGGDKKNTYNISTHTRRHI